MKKILFLSLSLMALLLQVSCERQEPEPPEDTTPKDPTEVLTSGKWLQKEQYEYDESSDDWTPYGDVCETDNEWLFLSDGEFSYREGANVCEPDFPINFDGTWSLSPDFEKLYIRSPFLAVDFFVDQFNDSTVTLLMIDETSPDDPPAFKIVLKR
jgi:hypothetical protein